MKIALKYLMGTILFIIFFVLLFNLVHYIQYKTYSYRYCIDKSWVDVVGTVANISHAPRGIGSRFDYLYKGKNYHDVQSAVDIKVYNMVVGEKYILKINPKFPERYVPIVWQPVFEDEETQKTNGTIVKVNNSNIDISPILFTYSKKLIPNASKCEIYYKYTVNGTTYVRGQYLSPDINLAELNVNIGATFEVQYMLNNPDRAIIKIQ